MGTGRGGVDGAHVIARKRMQRKVFGLVHEVAVVLLLPVEDLPALEALQRPRVVPKTAQLIGRSGVHGAHVSARKPIRQKVLGPVHELAPIPIRPPEKFPVLETLLGLRVVPKTALLPTV